MHRIFHYFTLASLIISSILLTSCNTLPGSENRTTPIPSTAPTATTVPWTTISLKPGDFYFSEDGTPGFLFSHNVTGYRQSDFSTFLYWTSISGGDFARIQIDSLGMGYTSTGAVDMAWAGQWDQVFNKAEAEGIYVIPVFSVWCDWNSGAGYSTWKNNPLNQANGGPVKSPSELFEKDSITQKMWIAWMKTLVERWQGRKNILAWEIFSEVNLASGVRESTAIGFIDNAAAVIRAADTYHRPVTASMADDGKWSTFYRDAAIDFINIHPYPPSGQLDRTIVTEVRKSLIKYKRPVLIGESGLSAETPDSNGGKLTVAENASLGVEHAIWAGMVSGAMNGRALWWEDSYGIYFPSLGMPYLQKYQTVEKPAVNFMDGINLTGFTPLTSTTTPGIWGASIGNDHMSLGWYRDAGCEPPDWKLRPVLTKQSVKLTVPGTATNWRVDFYDVSDGTTILSSIFLTSQGNILNIPLPDFQDAIAFKARS